MKICVKEGYRRKEEAKNHNTYIINQTPIVTHTKKKNTFNQRNTGNTFHKNVYGMWLNCTTSI